MGFWAKIKTKIKNSLKIMGYSFSTIFKDKNYFFILCLSILTFIIIIGIIAAIIEYTVTLKEAFNFLEDISRKKTDVGKAEVSIQNALIAIGAFFVISVVGIVTTTFFAVATSYYTLKSFEQDKVNIWTALGHSFSKLWIILKWGVVATIVSMLLKMLTDKNGKQRSSFIAGFLFARLGDIISIAWYLITFLIPAVIAFENLGLYASIKQSARVMKKTFGENVTADLGFSVLTFFAVIISSIFGFIITIGLGSMITITKPVPNLTIAFLATPIVLFVVFTFFLISLAKTIFKTAVYAYATDRPTGNFPPNLITANFYEKKKETL